MITQPNALVYPHGSIPFHNLDKFFLGNRAAGQTFVIDPMRRTTVVGSRGTRLTIVPNAFQDATGWPVREPVTLFLREVFTRPEMILAGLSNTSEDRILETAGQILLEATAGEQPLQLAAPLAVDLPLQNGVSNPLASQLFSGGVSQTASFGSELRFDWKAVKSRNIQLKTLGEKRYLHFLVDKLNWWNCTSFFHRRRSRLMMSVRRAGTESTVHDLAAFLVFRDFNAVVRMYPGRHGFSSWNIPKEVMSRVILIGCNNEGMLAGVSEWALTSSQPIVVGMEACSQADLLAWIPEWTAGADLSMKSGL